MSNDSQYIYHAWVGEFGFEENLRAMRAIKDIADENGVEIGHLSVQYWTKADGWHHLGVAVNYDDVDWRRHRSQMEMDGWTRRG